MSPGLGQHFTEPRVAELMAALGIRGPADRVLDPACGDGALLRAASRWTSKLIGVETDSALAARAAQATPAARILAADFLTMPDAPHVNVVLANPPYIRHELLSAATKSALRESAMEGISGRADIHLHFWPKSAAAVSDGGRLVFLTSGMWLDAGYGAALRRWIAESFRILAIIESAQESWFPGARVRAVITVLEKKVPHHSAVARFVRVLPALTSCDPEDLAAAILSTCPDPRLEIREVPQADLSDAPWGSRLREPQLCEEIRLLAGDRLVPLETIATVRWGIKTGDDGFFFMKKWEHSPVESRYLAPVVFNLMELDRLTITPEDLGRRVLLVDWKGRRNPPSAATRLGRYLAQGVRRGTPLRPTCAARERARPPRRRWFELRPGAPGAILWSVMHQYRHLAPLNPDGAAANDNLLLIDPRADVETELLAAVLNSHLQALLKLSYGRWRNEGMIKTQAVDVRRMLIVDPRSIAAKDARRLRAAFRRLAHRPIGSIPVECGRPDRVALDEAMFRALGVGAADAAAWARRVAAELKRLHTTERHWEESAIGLRRGLRLKSRPRVSPGPGSLR